MILLDLQPVMIANLVAHAKLVQEEFSEDLLRHMVLNSIRIYRNSFRSVAPNDRDFVIACEGGRSWRNDVFSYYKANRKKDKDNSIFDWSAVFSVFDTLRQEMKEHLPYTVVEVKGAEADDVIGVLARTADRAVIISRDHDFQQLQRDSVTQWDPINKSWITGATGPMYLREHIIRGDRGDGVPNVLSDDDTFVNPSKKSTVLSEKRYQRLWTSGPETDWELRNWKRNEELVDLSKTPATIQDAIVASVEEQKNKGPKDVYGYFVNKGLRNLMEHLSEF